MEDGFLPMIALRNFRLLRRIFAASGPFIVVCDVYMYVRKKKRVEWSSYCYQKQSNADHDEVHEDAVKSESGIHGALHSTYCGDSIVCFFDDRIGEVALIALEYPPNDLAIESRVVLHKISDNDRSRNTM